MKNKTIIYETVEHIQKLNSNGNLEQQELKRHTNKKVEVEPDFIKLYIKDICKLNDIPTAGNNILNELLKYMNYDNQVLLPTGVKQLITKELNLGKSTLDNTLNNLVKKDIIKRIGIGIYKLNPYIFGRGKWQDIKEIRATWVYGKSGRALIGLEVDKIIEESDI